MILLLYTNQQFQGTGFPNKQRITMTTFKFIVLNLDSHILGESGTGFGVNEFEISHWTTLYIPPVGSDRSNFESSIQSLKKLHVVEPLLRSSTTSCYSLNLALG